MSKYEVYMGTKNNSKEIMTTKDVAEFLNLHPLTVQKMARGGTIPAFKIGADWRFKRQLLDRWIREKVEYQTNGKERRKPEQQEFER